jgi:hypothetical protein
LRANGSRARAPDDRLREAIHPAAREDVDCFVASASRDDGRGYLSAIRGGAFANSTAIAEISGFMK